ncbi:MAG TPA: hypothetical protein VGK23_09830 [Methanomassiliicoccales archaeon]|jgi:hypothetical protein
MKVLALVIILALVMAGGFVAYNEKLLDPDNEKHVTLNIDNAQGVTTKTVKVTYLSGDQYHDMLVTERPTGSSQTVKIAPGASKTLTLPGDTVALNGDDGALGFMAGYMDPSVSRMGALLPGDTVNVVYTDQGYTEIPIQVVHGGAS